MSSRRSGRTSGAGTARDMPSSSPDESVTVQTSRSTRGANRRNERPDAAGIVHGTRNRGGRKNYVIDSSPDDDDDEDAEADGVGEADEDAEGDEMEVDAEGEELDAEGEEDAEGDVDMDASITSGAGHTIRVSQPAPRSAAKAAAAKIAVDEEDEDDEDDEDDLSDPADSDDGEQTIGFGDETMADEDAEGEEIEVAGEEDEEDEDEDEEDDDDADVDADADVEGGGEVGSGGAAAGVDGDEGSQEEYPDLTKMTKRQRARFEDEPQEYMKLSDEVQVKKHFTAEELSMRRQEMARRRRNLSEKRTEEVKMETINKLLKKQAPKVNRKAAAAAARGESPDEGEHKSNSTLIRWINNKNGSKVSVPEDILSGPAGQMFSRGGGLSSGKMVEEVS